MKLSQDQIKEILDNAPIGASHYFEGDRNYYHKGLNYFTRSDCSGVSGFNYAPAGMKSLSHLRAQLEPAQEWKYGLPPIGEFVMIDNYDRKDIVYGHEDMGSEVEVVSVIESEGVAVVRLSFGLGVFDRSFFRKPETAEQKAARIEKELINEMMSFSSSMGNWRSANLQFAKKLIKAGYRKESK